MRLRTMMTLAMVIASLGGQKMLAAVAVGTCRPSLQSFTTIQDAVNAVPAQGTVEVCPGDYPEQVTISKPLTLTGVASGTQDQAVVVAPAGGVVANAVSLSSGAPIAAQIFVSTTGPVNISNLAVDGSNNGINSCGPPTLVGIFYQNSSGTVNVVAARNQALASGLGGCQNGLGIFVQSGNNLTSAVTIANSSVHSYQKNGITGNETGTTVTVTGNQVVGLGPTNGAAQNGIQIGYGATGKVMKNTVIDDIYSGSDYVAGGILIYGAAGVTVSGNTVANTQLGISLVTDSADSLPADDATVTSNQVSATHIFDGIDVCSNSNTVKSNIITSSDESGIDLDDTCGSTGNNNSVKNNAISEACAGILEGTSTTGNVVTANNYFNVGNTVLSAESCQSGLASAPLLGAKRRAGNTQAVRP